MAGRLTGAYRFRQTAILRRVVVQVEVDLDGQYGWRDAAMVDLLDRSLNSLTMLRERRHVEPPKPVEP